MWDRLLFLGVSSALFEADALAGALAEIVEMVGGGQNPPVPEKVAACRLCILFQLFDVPEEFVLREVAEPAAGVAFEGGPGRG